MSRSIFSRVTCAVTWGCGLLSGGCAPAPLAIPAAPEMGALVQSYEQPSAPFDPDEADELRLGLAALDALLERTAIATYVFDVLESVVNETETTGSDAEDGSGDGDLDLTLDADGYLRVRRICDGWVAPAIPDVQNGELDLTTTFTENGLDPVIWGNALRCRYLVGETPLELRQFAGSSYGISVYWGAGVDIGSLAERPLLFALRLTAVLGEEQLDLDLDFRTSSGREIEHRLERGGGFIVASISEDGTITLRAENGTFRCADGSACEQLVGGGSGG